MPSLKAIYLRPKRYEMLTYLLSESRLGRFVKAIVHDSAWSLVIDWLRP